MRISDWRSDVCSADLIKYKGKGIDEVLAMTVEVALEFFKPVPALRKKLETLMDVGLSYITLGQNATTLSGGEAQRVKLAKELSKRDTGQRSEERRVGQECVSPCGSQWSPYH